MSDRSLPATPKADSRPDVGVRLATPSDADAVGHLLHDFNTEFDEATPGAEWLAGRVCELIAGGQLTVLLAGDGPDGLAALRFRPALWSAASECYLAELYVVPARRGRGLGRALLEAAMAHARGRGADYMELGTAETDTVARALYESCGFDNHEGKPGGPVNYCYEREL